MMKVIKTQCPWEKKTKKELWGFSFSFAPAVLSLSQINEPKLYKLAAFL